MSGQPPRPTILPSPVFGAPQIFGPPQPAQFIFNHSEINISPSEISATLSFSQRPGIQLIMPPVTAKTFALDLLKAVENYEAMTSSKVQTEDEIRNRVSGPNE